MKVHIGIRLHGVPYTWGSWHRQSGASCDEVRDLCGRKLCVLVDRYAKFGNRALWRPRESCAAVTKTSWIWYVFGTSEMTRAQHSRTEPLKVLVGRVGIEPTTNGLRVRCSTS